jgi:acyl carrier protein
MDICQIEDKVRTFIIDSFLSEADVEKFRDDSDLLKVLDSLQILRMVIVFEGVFAIKIADSDLTPENLGSVKKVACLVARKRTDDQTLLHFEKSHP